MIEYNTLKMYKEANKDNMTKSSKMYNIFFKVELLEEYLACHRKGEKKYTPTCL